MRLFKFLYLSFLGLTSCVYVNDFSFGTTNTTSGSDPTTLTTTSETSSESSTETVVISTISTTSSSDSTTTSTTTTTSSSSSETETKTPEKPITDYDLIYINQENCDQTPIGVPPQYDQVIGVGCFIPPNPKSVMGVSRVTLRMFEGTYLSKEGVKTTCSKSDFSMVWFTAPIDLQLPYDAWLTSVPINVGAYEWKTMDFPGFNGTYAEVYWDLGVNDHGFIETNYMFCFGHRFNVKNNASTCQLGCTTIGPFIRHQISTKTEKPWGFLPTDQFFSPPKKVIFNSTVSTFI